MEVLKYLETHSLQELCDEFSIKVSQNELYPELYVLNYSQIDSPKAHSIVVECRSLVLGSIDEGKTFFMVSRAFDRFFNYSENGYSPDISKLTCYEKLDGSLVSVFHYKGEWLYRTKSMIMPTLQINGFDRTWKDLIEDTLEWSEHKPPLGDEMYTYIFEVVSMENRVVVRYEEDRAYLLAKRNNATGECIVPVGARYVPRKYNFSSTEECMASVKELPNLEEGYVAYNEFGVPVCKIKSPAYLVAHRIKGEGLTPKRIRELVVINEQDEYLAVFPEDRKYFTNYIESWNGVKDKCIEVMSTTVNVTNQKEFALLVKDYPYCGVLFTAKRSGKCVEKVLTEQTISYKVKLLETIMEVT